MIIGEVNIVQSMKLNSAELPQHYTKYLVDDICQIYGQRDHFFVWVLENAYKYPQPIPFQPPFGGNLLDQTQARHFTVLIKNWTVPLDPKTMKNEGFKPPIYGFFHP